MTAPHAGQIRGTPDGRSGRWSLELAAASLVGLVTLVVLSFWDVRDTGWGSWFVPITAVAAFAAGIGAGAAAALALAVGDRRKALALPISVALVCTFALVAEIFLWE